MNEPHAIRTMVPATRLDAWRLRRLPRWALRLWPVRYREVEVLAVTGLSARMKRTWSAERLEQLRNQAHPMASRYDQLRAMTPDEQARRR